jgi:hypothetical protein
MAIVHETDGAASAAGTSRWKIVAFIALIVAFVALLGLLHERLVNRGLIALLGFAAGPSREIPLTGPQAWGRAFVDHDRHYTVFLARHLPQPDGRRFVVWVEGARTYSPGVLEPARGGIYALLVRGDVLSGARAVTVRLQGAAGSTEGRVVLRWDRRSAALPAAP